MSTTTNQSLTSPCPECAATVAFTRPPLQGEVIRCRECTAKLDATVRRQRVARQREAEPTPFTGTQSQTSHESTLVVT